jgi:hypothetical protein
MEQINRKADIEALYTLHGPTSVTVRLKCCAWHKLYMTYVVLVRASCSDADSQAVTCRPC